MRRDERHPFPARVGDSIPGGPLWTPSGLEEASNDASLGLCAPETAGARRERLWPREAEDVGGGVKADCSVW